VKVELPPRIQTILDRLVALDASSRLEAVVVLTHDSLLLLNTFSTLLMRFPLQAGEGGFRAEVVFSIRDYEGKTLLAHRDGSIEFLSSVREYNRRKRCLPPTYKAQAVTDLWDAYSPPERKDLHWKKGILRMLDPDLSHVEIQVKRGEIALIQRDVATHQTVEVTRREQDTGFLASLEKGPEHPISIRTADFFSLFSFAPVVGMTFPRDRIDYCWVYGESDRFPFAGVISCCLYEGIDNGKAGNEKAHKEKASRRTL
jgi:hypothetical protein